MTKEEIKAGVLSIIGKTLNMDESEFEGYNDDTSIVYDLGADSLDNVNMVIDAETKFGIRISDEDFDNIFTIADAIDCIDKLLNKTV